MSTIKQRREELAGYVDHLSSLLSAKGEESPKALLAAVEAYAQPNGSISDDVFDSLVNIESALDSVVTGIAALTHIRKGESDGFVNGVNRDAGLCRIVADTPFGYSILSLCDYDPKFDTLYIDSEAN